MMTKTAVYINAGGDVCDALLNHEAIETLLCYTGIFIGYLKGEPIYVNDFVTAGVGRNVRSG